MPSEALATARLDSTTEDLLREIVSELRAVRQCLAQRRPSHLTRDDRRKLGMILPVIAATFGSELFTVREVFEHASAGLRIVLAESTRKQLGRLLQRAEGAIVDGFTVQRDGVEVGAVLWRILATTPP